MHYNNIKANSHNNIPFGVCKPLPSTSSSSVPLIPSPFGVGDGSSLINCFPVPSPRAEGFGVSPQPKLNTPSESVDLTTS